MLRFCDVIRYKHGFVFCLLSESFAGVIDDGLEGVIRKYDDEVFDNADTVGACAFVTESDGEVVGMASWDPRGGPDAGQIGWICILPKYQGNGFGQDQVKEILRRLKGQGFRKVFVKTGEHPFFERAQKMYTACGFKEFKRYPTGDQPGYGTIEYEIEL